MANYKQTTISGSSYQRARLISITNEYNSNNSITFVEEVINFIGDQHVHTDVSQIKEILTPDNALTQFNLLNPQDDSIIGIATYQDLYVLLYSLYMKLAADRDAIVPTQVVNIGVPAE